MLKRFHAHNFRTLVNFEMVFDQLNLLMGNNSSGKSTLLDALYKVRLCLTEQQYRVGDLFPLEDFTHWYRAETGIQSFELEWSSDAQSYQYKLALAFDFKTSKVHIQREHLSIQGLSYYTYDFDVDPNATVHQNSENKAQKFLVDRSRSGLSTLLDNTNEPALKHFRNLVQKLFVFKIDLLSVSSQAAEEAILPNQSLSNYASWFRYLSQAEQSKVLQFTLALREVMPNFDAMHFTASGDIKILHVQFRKQQQTHAIRFHRLSEGQKITIILYTLIHCLPSESLLGMDEPENYLALPEIHHWLNELENALEDSSKQALLISHHPRLINLLASHHGVWFQREDAFTPSRIAAIVEKPDGGLPISKLMEMGWLIDD